MCCPTPSASSARHPRSRSGSCGVHRRQIRGYDPAYIDTFLRRRGEEPGARVRAVTEIEAKIRGIKRHPVIRKTSDRVADRLTEAGKPVPAALLDPDTVTNAVAAAGADSTDVITTPK